MLDDLNLIKSGIITLGVGLLAFLYPLVYTYIEELLKSLFTIKEKFLDRIGFAKYSVHKKSEEIIHLYYIRVGTTVSIMFLIGIFFCINYIVLLFKGYLPQQSFEVILVSSLLWIVCFIIIVIFVIGRCFFSNNIKNEKIDTFLFVLSLLSIFILIAGIILIKKIICSEDQCFIILLFYGILFVLLALTIWALYVWMRPTFHLAQIRKGYLEYIKKKPLKKE